MAIQVSTEILEGSVLALLTKEDYYGYAITREVKKVFPISESTMYPILRRLKKEDWLSTYDEAYEGRNRRYYKITDQGLERLGQIRNNWQDLKAATDAILEGNNEE
ncbi:PadR family transcriptional regulator [Companilactobacillus nantensis]|uniref:PadR family transcriptional regulator, regulatory protein PadR n=1 Tax=Companilactobacillus nantensis DSM 16982 TaxID=1423774 RepID=A0A0R1WD56_9LACO|nr:PadR family transcriptional regulator [Companilactobacillus nantensis]KRM15695.1 PadR family transcriptional regulator, regulatory protein PadR [Companilactobacillus nantensis DSM 16982]GEO64653.1 PadR family transcriptional regulator [Companilactobacillus nantensis]